MPYAVDHGRPRVWACRFGSVQTSKSTFRVMTAGSQRPGLELRVDRCCVSSVGGPGPC